MENTRHLITLVLLMIATTHQSLAFSQSPFHRVQQRMNTKGEIFSAKLPSQVSSPKSMALHMGLFDGLSKAFSNQEFKAQDQRVRASHILIKGDDVSEVLGKIRQIMGELNERVEEQSGDVLLQPIFSELARRESECPSAARGGDLGLFGPKKMVKEFDEVLFPSGEGVVPPPVGSILGPVVTDFGCHVILVTQREQNRDQVEEKLARND
mmetsp:Transcript_46757/g.69153  ORF Transcript_46757/g.69153 Transcript_46757/m.69153 type:complete len:210 (-) Transcript_46757:14-643(-)|eukprot:CAMPEP_0195523704 /NCGR_PEP_ID=MMETSP0794_2-20130614/23049_1 /TAXON_ID=515487 /ORGANISM="Stephanopyxis turris, Strain CCMP 815" /LENGTH=209 /DNA_ID=CAMNT_0040653759 /DNA_START=75 /DNA_END=704 /DNA_ORIENTATION=-